MAILSKIRNRSGLLLILIGFALLAFVVQDLFSNGFKSISKDVGSVNGKDIAYEDFRTKVANAEKNGQNGQQITALQASNQVWNQEVNITLLTAEFEKLGLRVGEKHIVEVFKADPNIGQNPMFLDATGKFDVKKFKDYFKSNPEGIQILKEREKDAELNAKYQIYNSLVKGGLYTTEAEGKFKYEAEMNKVSFDFVTVPFSSIKDSDVKISDEEILAYMKTKEKKFKSEETRELDYVLIQEKPSTEDETEVKNKINSLLTSRVEFKDGKNDTIPSFQSAKNTAEFVNQNSDIPFDSTYISKQDLPAEHADKLYGLATGEVYGPYLFSNYYCISKSLGKKPNAKAKSSHILISWVGATRAQPKENRTKEQAKVKAEGLLAQVLANPAMFQMIAMTSSEDPSVQQNGGDMGYITKETSFAQPFKDFVFNNPVGKIGLVETDFGYHIINVTDKQDAIQLATIAEKIEPSEATNDKIYTQATKFEMDATAGKDFAALTKEAKLTANPSVRVKPIDESFGAINNQRQIVKWAFANDTNIGDVKRFEVTNVGHVIAKLKKVTEKGLMSVEEARPQVEGLLKNKKKAEMIKAKMTGSSLGAIAASNKVTVQSAIDLTIESPAVPGAGFEPKVVGTAFSSKTGQVSKTIDGNSGVYVLVTKTVAKAPAIAKYTDYVNKLKPQVQGNAGRFMQALKNDADIQDNRADFY